MVDSIGSSGVRAGLEIAHSSLTSAVIDERGEIVATRSVFLEDGETLPQIIACVDALKSEFGGFSRLGVAVPGLVDHKTGRVAFSAHIPSHVDVDLVKDIESATGLGVDIENDANAAACAEYHLGSGRGSRDIFYATLGDGVGGAFIFNGEIWHGESGFAGEFGYVAINSEGMRLEDVASAANIVRRTRSRYHQDSTSSLSSIDEESITLGDLIAAAEQDDDFAKMMLERTGTYVGTAIASVINLLNIETIVVGGDIMSPKGLVLNAIVERARELSFEPSFAATNIVEGEFGPNAAAVGVAFLSGQKH